MWHLLLKFVLSLLLIFAQFAFGMFAYINGKQNGHETERQKWREWLKERKIPREHFLQRGVFINEPAE